MATAPRIFPTMTPSVSRSPNCVGYKVRQYPSRFSLRADPGDKITVVVDANPFLNKYEYKNRTLQPTADSKALTTFADALQGVSSALFPKSGNPLAEILDTNSLFMKVPSSSKGIRIDDLPIDFVPTFLKQLADVVSRSSRIKSYTEDAIAYTSVVPQSQRPAAKLKWADESIEVGKWPVADDFAFFRDAFAKLADVHASMIQLPTLDAQVLRLVESLLMEQAHVSDLLNAQADFKAKALLVGHDISADAVTMTSTQDYSEQLIITAANPDDKTTKTITVKISAYNPIVVGIGPSLVYSFAKNTADDTYVGQKAAVMLTIAPSKWAKYILTPEAQIGVSSGKDSLGFFFGVGLRAPSVFDFVAGANFQQVKTATQPQIKTEYRWAFFVGITVDMKTNAK